MGTNVRQNIVTNGLVLYLDAGNRMSYPGSGTTWSDLSGQGNNGTLQSSPVFNSANQGNISFDGVAAYISTTTNLGSNPLPIHTFSVWFRTSVASGKKIIGVENNQTGTGSTLYDRTIYMGTDGKIYYGVYDNTLAHRVISSLSTLNDNNWHNAVGICTGANLNSLYIDGIFNSSITGNAYSSYTTSYIRLGSYWLAAGWTNGTQGYFTGNIANVQVYNRALSAQEVAQNYNATKTRFGLR